MLTYYHSFLVIFYYRTGYIHIASPSLVRNPDSYPWRRAALRRDGAEETSICRSLMMAVTFSRTIFLRLKRSSPATQVRKYCLTRVGFCLHIPSNWVQN